MTVKEVLATRDKRYAGWSEDALIHDALDDVTKLLNVFTDIQYPDAQDIAAIEALSKAVKNLHEVMHEHEEHSWEKMWPEVAQLKHELDEAFHNFMETKASGADAAAHIPLLFESHKHLAGTVKKMCTTPAETAAIQAAVKA